MYYFYLQYQINLPKMFRDDLPIFNIDLDCEFQSSDNQFPSYPSKNLIIKTQQKTIIYKQQQNYTLYSNLGKRKDNLDRGFSLKTDKMIMYALLDGHCDPQPLIHIQKNILNRLSVHPKLINQTQQAILQVFQELQKQVIHSYQKGTTALILLLTQKDIIIANLGDSIVYAINHQDRITKINQIHNLTNSNQLMKVINQGGIILKKGTQYRINGELNLSRCFGDRKLKYCMESKPDIYKIQRNKYKRIVMATDGFYNCKQIQKKLLLKELKGLQNDQSMYLDNATAIYIEL